MSVPDCNPATGYLVNGGSFRIGLGWLVAVDAENWLFSVYPNELPGLVGHGWVFHLYMFPDIRLLVFVLG